jgi:hypothetical protein
MQLLDATSLRKGGTMRKTAISLNLQPIEISSEEILADLLYPAPTAKPKPAPKRAPIRRKKRA